MIKEKIKNYFKKKHFVFDDLKLELQKDIADEVQSNFDELICIAKLKGYQIEKENFFGHLILTIYYKNYHIFCMLYLNRRDKKMKDIGVSLENQSVKNYQGKEMIEVLQQLKKVILEYP